ncbi:MAG TPA: DinB family protein [Pyrinomonadaceae bacterium]|nr:DinB family protein [Pyrinomonadaceae bacterium]
MWKSDIDQPPCYFDRYIDRVDDVEILDALNQSVTELENLPLEKLKQLEDVTYADHKWTIKEIFQHLIDAEHVLSYRALRIGRNDKTELPGFDQDLFAANVSTKGRSLERIVNELKLLRRVTGGLFESFDDEAELRSLVINGNQMSALAYGFAIVGHQKHHLRIIEEKYLPLLVL